MLLDKTIYAARVRFKNSSRYRIDESVVAFRGAAETKCAELLVNIDRSGAKNFRKLATRDASQQIHLPQPVLRHHVTLRLRHVFDGTRANMRHAPLIALHDHIFLQSLERDVAVELRQRTIDESPENGCRDQDDNAGKGDKDAKQGSQACSSRSGETPSLEEHAEGCNLRP